LTVVAWNTTRRTGIHFH